MIADWVNKVVFFFFCLKLISLLWRNNNFEIENCYYSSRVKEESVLTFVQALENYPYMKCMNSCRRISHLLFFASFFFFLSLWFIFHSAYVSLILCMLPFLSALSSHTVYFPCSSLCVPLPYIITHSLLKAEYPYRKTAVYLKNKKYIYIKKRGKL